MTALTLIGFLAVVLFAAYVTFASGVIAFSELAFGGRLTPFSLVLATVSGALWALAWWLSPFTLTLEVTA